MKPAKPDYYDPKLKGREDGHHMETLPPIVPPPPKIAQKASSHPTPAPLTKPKSDKPVVPSTSQSTSRSTVRSVDPSANPSFDTTLVLGRPKAFYITQKQDEDLDVAVGKLNKQIGERINQKIDRSTVIRLLLEQANLTSEQTIAKLINQLTRRLISQLTG